MAKTLEEAYSEIKADEAKLAEFRAVRSDDELVKFASSCGVTASAEEIKEFIKGKNVSELTESELEQVAGGVRKADTPLIPPCTSCGSSNVLKEVTIDTARHAKYTCLSCGYVWESES